MARPVALPPKAPGAGGTLPPQVLAPEGLEWHTVEPKEAKPGAEGVVVPPKRGGWVRLEWNGEKLGDQKLGTAFWMNDIYAGVTVNLEVAVRFIEALRVLPDGREIGVGPINVGDRPKEVSFTVVSATRDTFTLEPMSEEAQKEKHPFVRAGKPVPLTADQLKKLTTELKLPVLSGYSVPVTVRERLDDGRQNDMGPFRTGVRLKSDASDEELTLVVNGTVHGDIVVASDAEKDRIRLETFSAKNGMTKTAILESNAAADLELEKKPDFMDVELKATTAGAGGRKTWQLTVKIGPNAVNGPFPRQDDALLRDTAVYLKTKSEPPRRIRIPVSGTAATR